MLKIKLTRIGKKGQPQYRFVVIEGKDKNTGKYIDLLGNYNPLTKPSTIDLNMIKYNEWIAKGATPTRTVYSLAKKGAK